MFGITYLKSFCDTAMLVFGLTKRLPTGGSCISNTLRTGRVARCITQLNRNKVFFNRKRELAGFKKAFSGDPELHVVLGSPSTGKTALIREVTSKGDFSPLFINCRYGQFDTPKGIHDSMTKSLFAKSMTRFKKLFQHGEINYTTNNIQLRLPFGDPSSERKITPNDILDMLADIGKSLPNWTR
jgi:hypothetical protein